MPSAQGQLAQLYARVDAFFERVEKSYPAPLGMRCERGCAECCQRFSVTHLEAEEITRALERLPEAMRSSVASRAASPGTKACPALESDGSCAIYDARPLICRTHGLPIRFASEHIERTTDSKASRHLPLVDTCSRNFAGQDLTEIDGDCVLDQNTLSTILGALDAAFSVERNTTRGTRVEITDLCRMAKG